MLSRQGPCASAAASRGAPAGSARRSRSQAHAGGGSSRAAASSRRGGRLYVQSPAQGSGSALTPAGVVPLDADAAAAEQARLESTDAFAELVKLSSLGGAAAGQPPSAASAFSSGGLKKPPWLRQRAPQGDRCVLRQRLRLRLRCGAARPPAPRRALDGVCMLTRRPWRALRRAARAAPRRYEYLKGSLRDLKLNTVCEEAQCPNIGEVRCGVTQRERELVRCTAAQVLTPPSPQRPLAVLEWRHGHCDDHAAGRHVHARLPLLRRQHGTHAAAC